ncbi:hypothetical protein BEWA_019040 [Theileria equi strain WA]|uniref:Uncharacterized protein n=1 Tax=Theileria equi strain WA TaxID=1537102 RepID=L0AVY4_THEEQ|nr:hypothetical protein BEWA_019040 [Theileria equi strain WA]AFZ79059.1 hypothetical protein BEWA_019040 [Theileria equi strain WA]|eukprot:XP_004828725.1 hypothetical protein BEWA_019040 [Theileria equi strain WA]
MRNGMQKQSNTSENPGISSPQSVQAKRKLWNTINNDKLDNEDLSTDHYARSSSASAGFDDTYMEFRRQHTSNNRGRPRINTDILSKSNRENNTYLYNAENSLKRIPTSGRFDWNRNLGNDLTIPRAHPGQRKRNIADQFELTSSDGHKKDVKMLDDVFVMHANRNVNKFGDPFESFSDSITTINSFPSDSPRMSYSNKNIDHISSDTDDASFVSKFKLLLKRVGSKIKKCFCTVSTKSKEYITRFCDKQKQKKAERNKRRSEQKRTKEPLLGYKKRGINNKRASKHSKKESINSSDRISVPFTASSRSSSFDFEATKRDKGTISERFSEFKSRSKSRLKNKNKKTSDVPHVTLSPFPGD